MIDTFRCYNVSWGKAQELTKNLAHKIKRSGFKPDLVIGIARGGLVPARIICDYLLLKDLASIKVEHWGIAKTLGAAKIKFPLPDEAAISGKKILIVDDVADTGETYSVIMEYLLKKNPTDIKTAALQYKTSSSFIPDFWGEKLEKWEWIVYPWAIYEDQRGFIERVLTNTLSSEMIRKKMKDDYNFSISKKDMREILDEMQTNGELVRIKKGRHVIWKKSHEGKSE